MPTRELLAPSQRAQFIELPSNFDERTLASFTPSLTTTCG